MGIAFDKLTPKVQALVMASLAKKPIPESAKKVLEAAGEPFKPKFGFIMEAPMKQRRRPTSESTESRIQQQVIRWWGLTGRGGLDERLLMAFPLQGKRTKANGARMKAEGMRAGTPDMFLAVPRGKYHGLWIELKRPSGRLTPNQKDMLSLLDVTGGYAAFAAYGFDDCERLIGAYLRGEEFF